MEIIVNNSGDIAIVRLRRNNVIIHPCNKSGKNPPNDVNILPGNFQLQLQELKP